MSIPGDIYGMGVVLRTVLGSVNIELPFDQNLHNQKVLNIPTNQLARVDSTAMVNNHARIFNILLFTIPTKDLTPR